MSTLAVIGTFYRRWERTPLLLERVMVESTRPPDEFWIMCEDQADAGVVSEEATADERVRVHTLPTPCVGANYAVVPYSNKINWALDRSTADYIVYLDNGSLPHIDKYRLMVGALDEHPDWGAVYCGQRRTGYANHDAYTHGPVADAYCVLNYTQVMHRRTADRWTLDMRFAKPDLADAMFWRALHVNLGPFYPVGEGELLDEHHMTSVSAL